MHPHNRLSICCLLTFCAISFDPHQVGELAQRIYHSAQGAPAADPISFQRTVVPLLKGLTDPRALNSCLRQAVARVFAGLCTPGVCAALERCLRALPPGVGRSIVDPAAARGASSQEGWEPKGWADVRYNPTLSAYLPFSSVFANRTCE